MSFRTFFLIIIYLHLHPIYSKIHFVFTMMRHGARAPSTSGTDIFGEHWNGPYELTEVGLRQQYLLGVRNRMKYGTLLSEKYVSNEVYAVSSDLNRTLLSASAHLQGLYQPLNGNSLHSEQLKKAIPPVSDIDLTDHIKTLEMNTMGLGIQIVPVHVFPERDKLVSFKKNCQNYEKILEENSKSDPIANNIKDFNERYKDELLKILHINDKDYFMKHKNIVSFCHSFISDYIDSKELRIFNNSNIDLAELAQKAYDTLLIDNYDYWAGNKDFNKAYSSPVLKEISHWTKIKVDELIKSFYSELSSPNYVLYSLHDYDLSSLLEILKEIFNLSASLKIYPSFSSSITFELHSNDNKELNELKMEDFIVKSNFNDGLILEVSFKEFKEKIEKQAFSESQIAQICNNSSLNQTNASDNNSNPDIIQSNINYYAVFACVFGLISLFEFIIILRKYKPPRVISTVTEFLEQS